MAAVAFVVMAMIFPILDAIKVNPLSERASLWLVVTVAYLIVISAIIYHQATAEKSSWVIGVGNGIMLLIAYTILAVFPRLGANGSLDEFMDSFGLFGFITMPLLILAPPRPMLQRLAVLLLGLAVLVSANIATNHAAEAALVVALAGVSVQRRRRRASTGRETALSPRHRASDASAGVVGLGPRTAACCPQRFPPPSRGVSREVRRLVVNNDLGAHT